MIVKLLTEHDLEFLCLKGGCRGPSESTHVKMPHCWKSHALAQFIQVQEISVVSHHCEMKVRRDYAYVQNRQSIYCTHSQSMAEHKRYMSHDM